MAIRIDTAEMHGTTVISVQGQLVGDASAELGKVLAAAEPPVAIDLAMLQTADTEGIEMLVAVAADGVELLNATGYVGLLMERNRRNREHNR